MVKNLISFDGQKPGLGLPDVVEGRLAEQYSSESADAVHAQKKLMGKKLALVLRHDDVQADALKYLPLYDELGVKATWYVVSQHMGTVERGIIHATEADIVALHEAGHEIGSHTQTHLYFNEATESQRRTELAGSKRDLEALLGVGYRCETFAYPGNWGRYDKEVGDYYIWGTTGVTSPDIYGQTHTLTDIDTISNSAEYPDPLLGATVAETITKTKALLAEFKAREALTIYTLQSHNLNEVPLDHMRAILETVLADDAADVVTMREAAHFVRSTLRTRDGRFHGPDGLSSGDTAKQVTLAGTRHNAGGYIVDRVTNFGKAFVAKVNGTVKATLDEILVITGTGISRFENGHKLRFYDPTNSTHFTIEAGAGGVHAVNFSGAGVGRINFNGALRTQTAGTTLEAYNSGTPIFRVDTSRQTFYIRGLSELPSGSSQAGEMCVVNNVLHVYGGSRWIPVGNDYGATTQRPTSPTPGQTFWDTTIGKMIWWDGSAWVTPTVTPV